MLDGFNNRRKKQRKRTILLETWNVQGIRNKTEEIMKAITEMKEDIIILTETKKKGSGLEGRKIVFENGKVSLEPFHSRLL